MTLAAAGDPVSLAYMGSRTLKRLGKNNLIVPVTIPEKDQEKYQPGILKTVSSMGKFWGFPHAFSTKALFINCGMIEKAGMQCVGPHTWEGMYQMAKTVKDKLGVAGVGLVAKDFDNTMHQFLNVKPFTLRPPFCCFSGCRSGGVAPRRRWAGRAGSPGAAHGKS